MSDGADPESPSRDRSGARTWSFPAGSALSQTGVAREYRVSRGPVREAFRLLRRDGLIASPVRLSEPDGYTRWEHCHHRLHMGLIRDPPGRTAVPPARATRSPDPAVRC